MKKILLTFWLFSIFYYGYTQTQSTVFKNTQRQTVDTTKKSFSPIIINWNQNKTKSLNTSHQKKSLLNSFATIDTSIKVKYSKTSKLPVFIERLAPTTKSLKSDETRCFDFLENIKKYIGVEYPKSEFTISDTKSDDLGQTHIRMSQKHRGIEVFGSDFYVHLKKDKEQFTGNYHLISNNVDTVPNISELNAIEIVCSDLKTKTTTSILTDYQKRILQYDRPEIKLVLKDVEGTSKSYSLMYQVIIRPNFIQEWIYFINAIDGTIYKSYDNTKYDGPTTANAIDYYGVSRTINTYFESTTYSMTNASETMYNPTSQDGIISTLDGQNTSTKNLDFIEITSTDNSWNNPKAVSVQYNTTIVYRYFMNTFNRNSICNNGSSIYSLINISNADGTTMDNASWNGKFAVYGNGSSNNYAFVALDIIGHELGHGVVGTSASLKYYAQSGAINETFADIFGSMVDRDDWLIGEDVSKLSKPMRDMSAPHNNGSTVFDNWQPMHMSEYVSGPILDDFVNRDNEGVHINSGITNYAYYLYANTITKEKAEQVYYRALTKYLTSASQFLDLRIAVILAATDLYGASSNEVLRAQIAFDAVGIYDDTSNNYFQDYTSNSGTQFLCYYDLEPSHPSSFYSSSIIGQNPVGLTTILAKSKMSITDDGNYGVYVSSTGTIRVIDMITKSDLVLQNDPIWSNVAISKDGNRLAAVTINQDTAIFVYDFNLVKWSKFHLYNPTTSTDNQSAGGVIYSDAIEFDITGEKVIYDAYNVINSATETDIYYWDIGLIDVWDNKVNNFADGAITKLYGSLPKNVSIGDPTFSKNSPYIIAFDYFDESINSFAVLGVNILTGLSDIIATNTSLGYPSYSKSDNILVFTSTDGSYETVKGIDLATNKISSSGSPILLINNAKWGVCYANGIRALGLTPSSNFTVDFMEGKSPLNVQFFDLSINDPNSWLWTFEGGTPSSSTEQNPIVIFNSPGTYSVSLKTTNSFGNNIKTKNSYITVSLPTWINDAKKSEVSFYPNPVSNTLRIKCDSEFSIKIYTLQGNLILNSINQNAIDLSNLKSGLYFIEIKTKNDLLINKLIKN